MNHPQNGPWSIAMLNNQRVHIIGIYSNGYTGLWVILSGIIILVYIGIIMIYNLIIRVIIPCITVKGQKCIGIYS